MEIFYNGQWGTVCDDFWSVRNAEVACRELGFEYAIRALRGYQVQDGTGQIWLDNVGCNGNEETLASCYHSGFGVHNCNHSDDAGVECSRTGNIVYLKCLRSETFKIVVRALSFFFITVPC